MLTLSLTKSEIMEELALLARQSDDAARAAEAEAAAFADEYEDLCTAHGSVDHSRMRELYAYVAERPRDARRLRKEAAVFRAAANFIAAT